MTSEAPAQFKQLFTPLRLGSFTVRNRIASTALPTNWDPEYWAVKAKGGIGLIIMEVPPVHASAGPMAALLWNNGPDPYRRIVDAVHQHGAHMIAQIDHGGWSTWGMNRLDPVWSASGIPSRFHTEVAHEMTVGEIRELIAAFASAAAKMKEAGFDGVEVHMGHDYIPEQFLSPLSNRRNDEYGGDEERRMRFSRELIEACREAVGPDYTLGIRISACEWEPGGLTAEDMQRITQKLAEPGQIDYVNVSIGMGNMQSFSVLGPMIPPSYVPPGQFAYLAAGIKQVVNVPVFANGRINTPALAEQILERGDADMIGMTRANIADPELSNKARAGRLDEIRYCIACNEGCLNAGGAGVTCAINPQVGRESLVQIAPAPRGKRVMVIGGGIAGMEAARVAAMRGHQVSLYERDSQLGGQLLIAAKAPGRESLAEPVRYYIRQFEILGVEVHLNTTVDQALVARETPEAVIVATGGVAAPPPVKGLQKGNSSGIKVVAARDVLAGTAEVSGDRVVVFATDQAMEGLTTADYLAEHGKQVEVLIPYLNVGTKLEQLVTRWVLLDRLARKKVKIEIMTAVKELRDGMIIAHNPPAGAEWPIEGVETLVYAAGSRADDTLLKSLRDQVRELYPAGECYAPRKLLQSALDGLNAGLKV